MANEITRKGKTCSICQECGFAYETKELAERCEAWCRSHNSCNIDITKNAVKF